jgi:hypothetical protein
MRAINNIRTHANKHAQGHMLSLGIKRDPIYIYMCAFLTHSLSHFVVRVSKRHVPRPLPEVGEERHARVHTAAQPAHVLTVAVDGLQSICQTVLVVVDLTVK